MPCTALDVRLGRALTLWVLIAAFFLSCTLALSRPARANLADGVSAYDSGDFLGAARTLTPLAESGDAEAQFLLGVMYDNGHGVQKDEAHAAAWYLRAAEQEHTKALYNLGTMYETGRGVPLDFIEALRWYHRAARQGAAKAENNIGAMYAYGRGVAPNFVQAHMWFNLAAAHLPPGGPREFSIQNRDLVALNMTDVELAEARELLRAWATVMRPAPESLAGALAPDDVTTWQLCRHPDDAFPDAPEGSKSGLELRDAPLPRPARNGRQLADSSQSKRVLWRAPNG